MRPPGDHFVLLTLPSGEDRLEPLLDLSPQGVAVLIRAHRPDIQPGNFLPRVRFFTNGECTLQCQATVRDVSQVSLETGGIGLKLGLRLELVESEAPAQPAVDTYDEPEIIADTVGNVLKSKSAMRVVATADAYAKDTPSAVAVRGSAEAKELVLKVTSGDASHLEAGATCELRGESYGTRLAIVTTFVASDGDQLRFSWPTRLAVWRHRVGGRVSKLPRDIDVDFESPFTREVRRRKVVDLSAKGLAFVGSPDDGLLVGMLIPLLTVRLPDGVARSRGVIRNVRAGGYNEIMVGVEFVGMSDGSARVLEAFVDAHLHPHVRMAQVSDLPRLWSVYEDIGLFERQHAAMSPTIGRVETIRNTLLTRARDLMIQIVGGSEDTIAGNAELLRTYSGCWSLQHVGVREDSVLTPDQLVVPLVEAGMRRKDFQHLHALLDPQRSRLGLARLRGSEPDADHLIWRERALVAAPEMTDIESADRHGDVQEAGVGDAAWVMDRLTELFKPLERQAFDLTNAELKLSLMERLYKNLGLMRRRLVRMAFSVTGPLGFSLVELTTPGVNFLGATDLVRLFPTRREAAGRRGALLALAYDAVARQREQGLGRTMFLLDEADAALLEPEGFTRKGERIEVIASRTGAAQIVNFINLLS